MPVPTPPPKKAYSKMSPAELEAAVRYHNYLYFVESAPEISDYEFDRIVRELQKVKPDSPVLQEIPGEGEERPKVRHRQVMLSLEKAYSEAEVLKWAAKFKGDLVTSPKIDGLAVEIRYGTDGKMELAATRGDGVQGDVITENARMVSDIPPKLPKGDLELRGEIYMRRSIFEKKYKGQFANPRNLSAGAIKQKDPRKTRDYHLSFMAYDILGLELGSEWKKFEQLKKWKIPTVEVYRARRDEVEKYYQQFMAQRDAYDYEIDGVVFKADDVEEQKRLGLTAHHPRWSIAYKFQGESGVTTLKDVEWSVARSHVITPIGIVEPVELSGAMVSRVSLHNYGLMMEKKLRRGAQVVMVRRGGVIPYLEGVESPGKGALFKAPQECPSCAYPTEVRDEFLYCTNKKGCAKSKVSELEHYVKVVEIDGFGPKLLARLYESGFVTEPADLYDLDKATLLQIERMGDKLASKLIRNVQDRRSLDLETFLTSLGIREIGRQVAKILARRFGSFEKLEAASEEVLTEVETVGPIIAEELQAGLKAKHDLIARLRERVKVRKTPVGEAKGKLAGLKFCFTGGMAAMPRSEGQKKVESLGAEAVNTVTKDLDYLVVGSEGGAGSKLDKAKKIAAKGGKIKIIEEKEFLKLL